MAMNLKYGSRGDEVKKMQEALIGAGYDLGTSGADGIYGDKTLAAVKNYQSKNGLAADGIFGSQTSASLYAGSGGTSGGGAATPAAPTTPQTATEWVKFYEDKLPGQYTSNWQGQIDALYDKVQNQPAFQYDFVSDPMYQHYADRYQQQGQRAMRDTMGQAAALTGGYGSSYGQMVGQQAYDQYLEGMNDIIPQLRSMAYEQYQNERAADLDALGILLDRENQEYGRWRDQQDDYADMRDYWYGKALDEAALAAAGRGGSGGGGGDRETAGLEVLVDPNKEPGRGFADLDFLLDQQTRVGITNNRVDELVASALLKGDIDEDEAVLLRQRYLNRNRSNLVGSPILLTDGTPTNPYLYTAYNQTYKPKNVTKNQKQQTK